ncbi:MAG: LysR family transcriptional regulator [Acidimicrobiales bacterium]|jgi:DNA-binding transcriptional LysR family regulator|nr:LysR family transcriptional regulator [Acidimicrobiales bacterium]
MVWSDVEIRHLAALRAVAEEGTFGRAAERLGFTQSAVSQQISALERAVGERMFDRPGGPRPATLTPAGRLMVEHAAVVLDRLAQAADELAALQAGSAGRIVVGTFQTVSVRVLPAVIGRFLAEHPHIEIRLVESDDQDDVLARLAGGELDLSFVVAGAVDERFEVVGLCEDPFVLVAPAASTQGERRPLDDLAGAPLIGWHAAACQALIDQELRAGGIEPDYVFRSNDNGAVQAMVRAGMGLSVMPLLTVDVDDPAVAVQRLDPPIPPRVIGLARAVGRTRLPAADRFVELAVDVCADLGDELRARARRRR